jgi:hypothetical protein
LLCQNTNKHSRNQSTGNIMKTAYMLLTLLLLAAQPVLPQSSGPGGGGDRILHKQTLHQYIVLEAFKILQQTHPNLAVKLQDHIGDMTVPETPWVAKTISAGAYREDQEDVAYSYGGPISSYHPDTDISKPGNCPGDVYLGIEQGFRDDPDFQLGMATSTHFWDPDATDNYLRKTGIPISCTGLYSWCMGPEIDVTIKPEANAMDKARRMFKPDNEPAIIDFWYNPGEPYYHPGSDTTLYLPDPNDQTIEVKISYTDLMHFYNTGECSIGVGAFPLTTGWWMDEAQRDVYVWEILGRVCHLLADMSVPAHTHKDIHMTNQVVRDTSWRGILNFHIVDADSYEQWVAHAGDGQIGDLNNVDWTAEDVLANWPQEPFIDPSNESDPLYFLMRSMRDLAATFASDEFDGTGGNGLPEVTTDIPCLHNQDWSPPVQPGCRAGEYTRSHHPVLHTRHRRTAVLVREQHYPRKGYLRV